MTPASSVSLVMIETRCHELATLEHWTRRLNFAEVITLSDRSLLRGATHVPIKPLQDENRDYGDIMIRGLWPFVKTDYMILLNWDTLMRDQSKWTDDFFNYDYIGRMYPWQRPLTDNTDHCGISWRSTKLLDAMRYPTVQNIDDTTPHHVSYQIERTMKEKFGILSGDQAMNRKLVYELDYEDDGESFAVRGLWNIINLMPRGVSEYYTVNCPRELFDDLRSSHEIVAAIVNRGYLDILQFLAPDIKASASYPQLINWLEQERFPGQSNVLRILT